MTAASRWTALGADLLDASARSERARRLVQAIVRVGVAAWLGGHAALWIAHGREPAALRLSLGLPEIAAAVLLCPRRSWRAGAHAMLLVLAAAAGVHAAWSEAPLGLLPPALLLCALLLDDGLAPRRLLRLRRAFEDGTLPKESFTHAAHLSVALSYVRDLGPSAALTTLREGLQRYLRAIGAPPDRYHETRTQAWLTLVVQVHERTADRSLSAALDAVLRDLGDSRLLSRHYSAALLDSPAARDRFIDPDLVPLPTKRTATSRVPDAPAARK